MSAIGTSAPLSAAVRKAEKTYENTVNAVDKARNQKAVYENLEKLPLMHNRLMPGFYLEKVSQNEKDIERKQRFRQSSLELLSVLTEKKRTSF